MKKINLNFNNIINLKNIIILLFSISCGLLSIYLMIGEVDNVFKIITFLGTFGLSIYFIGKNYDKIIKLILKNKLLTIVSLFASIIIMYELVVNLRDVSVTSRVFNVNKIYPFCYFGIFLIITIISIKIKDWLNKFVKQMDKFEKRAYIITSVIVLILLVFMYLNKVNFYHDYDVVYSMDPGTVYNKHWANPHYYDIRHPLTSILTFPVYAIVDFLCGDNIKPIALQFINVQLLIFIGLELKRLTKNKWVYIFYMLSFSSIIYILFLEKYILSVFLMVTYMYNIFINKKDSYGLLIFSIGTLPTNLYIMVTEFCKKMSFTKKAENLLKISALAMVAVLLTGRLPFIKTAFTDIVDNSYAFGTEQYTLINGFNSTTKMIESSFMALPSGEHEILAFKGGMQKVWIWDDITDSVSYVGLLVIFIIIIGIVDIIKGKKKIYYPLIASFIFSFILFMVLGWDIHESPLFAICFSFAIIPLFIYSLEKIFKILKIKPNYYKYIYLTLLLIMTIVNIPEIINIYNYIN